MISRRTWWTRSHQREKMVELIVESDDELTLRYLKARRSAPRS